MSCRRWWCPAKASVTLMLLGGSSVSVSLYLLASALRQMASNTTPPSSSQMCTPVSPRSPLGRRPSAQETFWSVSLAAGLCLLSVSLFSLPTFILQHVMHVFHQGALFLGRSNPPCLNYSLLFDSGPETFVLMITVLTLKRFPLITCCVYKQKMEDISPTIQTKRGFNYVLLNTK